MERICVGTPPPLPYLAAARAAWVLPTATEFSGTVECLPCTGFFRRVARLPVPRPDNEDVAPVGPPGDDTSVALAPNAPTTDDVVPVAVCNFDACGILWNPLVFLMSNIIRRDGHRTPFLSSAVALLLIAVF